ncbi:MAG: alanine dehydrogenase [Kiritimatiellae bacterium]|nr:alanine dehydrogenase [Kiritimatiellia bacterium]MCO5061627.1 alanine dehydrogenase [Kiritimatiellia bacterium]MCO6400489.1 alanine dehydrogenase [Verrucomicrobiota bacterium]
MKVGIPKEIKVKENRVAGTPAVVRALVSAGHTVLVQQGAGVGSGFSDEQYRDVGATLVPTAADAWSGDMVLKVKEPIEPEYGFLRPGLLLFTYLHLAADRALTERLVASKTDSIAYETVQVGRRLPLLEPMSEIAGRMSTIVGAFYLSRAQGGSGVLLGGVPGVLPAHVVILGGGASGVNAARMAVGLGATVTILELDIERMRFLDLTLGGSVRLVQSNEHNLMELLPDCDLLIGAVLVPGAKAPKLVSRDMLKLMKKDSVLVDIAIDQGGCFETSRATTHENPIFFEEDILHYCVANMPGAYCRTATQALTNATLPYAVKLANLGVEKAVQQTPELRPGLNTHAGHLTYKAVADAHGMTFTEYK